MATMWTLIEVCIADARRAEDLTSDLTARRELRLDPDSALAGFSLWREGSEPNELAILIREAA